MEKPKLVMFNEVFLEKSWEWLNVNELKKLTDTPDFTKDDQLKWYNSLPLKENYIIWGVTINEIPIGVFGIKNINEKEGEYWGYIGNKEYWGKGFGYQLLNEIMQIAKEKFHLRVLYLHVLIENKRAFNLYRKAGFRIADTIGAKIKMIKRL